MLRQRSPHDNERRKDAWDKMTAASALAASVLIPLALLLVGNMFSQKQKDAENALKYTELAVQILRAEPTSQTGALRDWAVEVLAKHAPVPLSSKAQDELKTQKVLWTYVPGDPNIPVDYKSIDNTRWENAATHYGTIKAVPAAPSPQ